MKKLWSIKRYGLEINNTTTNYGKKLIIKKD
jgi:hypothetical protein